MGASRSKKVLKKQQKNGSWKYPRRKTDLRSQENYDHLETYRQLGSLLKNMGSIINIKPFKKQLNSYFHFKPKREILEGFMEINIPPIILLQ